MAPHLVDRTVAVRTPRRVWPDNPVAAVWGTMVGKNVMMAVTGMVLVGFVIAHMLGNLKMFLGPPTIDSWPLPSAALTARCSCVALCHHVKREAGRFIASCAPRIAPPGGNAQDVAHSSNRTPGLVWHHELESLDPCPYSPREGMSIGVASIVPFAHGHPILRGLGASAGRVLN
jgi:hypothetical protein